MSFHFSNTVLSSTSLHAGKITSYRGAALLKFLIVLGLVPISIRRRIGRAAGVLFSYLPTRERAIAELQVQKFLPQHGSNAVVSNVFANVGQTILECLNLSPIIEGHPTLIYCTDPTLLEWVIAQKRPILGLTAHTGNWELFAAYFNARRKEIAAIGRPARSSLLQEVLVALRLRNGIRVLWRTGRSGMRDILAAFKEGAIVGALIDQDTRVTSIPVPFFGVSAHTPITLIEIAKRQSALVFSAFIARESNNTYSMHLKILDENGSSEQILQRYNDDLEAFIRKYPDQWVWFHKRWRTTASGDRLSGSEYIKYLHGLNLDG